MRVLLINPPLSSSSVREGAYDTYPLGLAYIAAVLLEKGHQVLIWDTAALGLGEDQIRKGFKLHNPDMVGITSMYTKYARFSYMVAKLAKEAFPDVPVVLGGAHPSISPGSVLMDSNVDIVVKGEGEITMLELATKLEKGEDILTVAGTTVRKYERIISNPHRPYVQNLDTLPFPARSLLPMDIYLRGEYRTQYSMSPPRADIITSRGCPGRCIFCSIHAVWGNRWRCRSPINVVDEIELLVEKYHVREIAFMDDNISVNKKRMAGICDELIKRKIDIRWCTPNGIAIWTLDRDLLRKMKRSGCYKLTFGIESGNKETLKLIGKGHIDLERAKEIIRYAKKYGIWTHSPFIIGFPWENAAQVRDTIKYAVNSGLDFVDFFIATPFPGTKLHDMFVEEGLMDPYVFGADVVWDASIGEAICDTKFFRKDELRGFTRYANWAFYSRLSLEYLKHPSRLVKHAASYEDLIYLVKLLSLFPGKLMDLASKQSRFLLMMDKILALFRKALVMESFKRASLSYYRHNHRIVGCNHTPLVDLHETISEIA